MEIVESLIEGFSNDKLRKLLDRNDLFRPNDEDLEYFEFKEFENIKNLGNIDFEDGYRFGLFSAKVKANLSERSGKKEQFKLAKKIIIDRNLEVAIFAFYDDDSKFRLSLIYREYLGTKSEYSPYKRFTFYVDKSRTNKTFKSQIGKCNFKSFQEIKDAFSVEPVTKEFYNEIQSWYFWAIDKVYFPDDAKISDNPEKDKEIRNSENLIRLITRVIFIWFLKEKDLVPEILFSKDKLKEIVKDFLQGGSCNYYNAILQNLFFATLNCEISKRGFASNEGFIKDRSTYGVKTLYRYSDKFLVDNDKVLELFKSVPFLNGGLFDCLDKEDENNRVVYVDGFSRNEKKTAKIPDYLFFHEEEKIDITKYLPSGKKNVRGLLDILSTYNFTVDENTPFDQEIALDPELLGKVFENLLAAYNPETSTTARKATGSYYTPREIVDYMVEESLVQLMSSRFSDIGEDKLRSIFSYSDESIDISEEEKERLVRAIFNLKILDPACGSGAFPMGILHKLVFALNKLDQDNNYWYELQLEKARRDWNSELNRGDGKEIQDRLSDIDKDFDEALTYPDYARKLYLIENCIYGVDIQPIAIQISKLRFFISLVIDQKVDKSKENFGIQPLPNLETKFVAANTLIGLKNPGYLYRIGRIAELENELKELKHRYFRPSDRATKLRYRKKDKELRKRLLDELTKNHYSIEDSERIANFDMFDQNASADWFDPEWMFGLVDGFDIVIGNPPYIQLQKNHGELANRYKELGYEVLDRMGDIYTLFYEKGIKILKDGGHLCFITSNKWMRAGYGEKLREFFSKYNPKILIDLGPGVFESATVDTNILLIQKSENKNLLKAITLQKDDKEDIKKALDKRCVILRKLSKDAWFIGSDAEQRLKEKIERIGKRLKDWDVKIYRGILTGLNEAFIITTEKRNEILDNCKDEEERKRTEAIIKPILRGRDIKRYSYEWANLWVIGTFPALHLDIDYYPALKNYFLDNFNILQLEQSGKQYSELGFNARKKTGNKWFETQDQIAYYPEFEKEKIVNKNIGENLAFTVLEPGIYTSASSFIMTSSRNKYICGVINSKVIDIPQK
ncbi:Eco57I restriction-modification methylase domain-containing protein [Thermodesulfobium sp.]